jgi:GAF domain-containing protein
VPMLAEGRVIGIIIVQSLQPRVGFDRRSLDTLCTIGNQAAVALENARRYETVSEQVERRTRHLQRLQAVAIEMTARPVLTDLLELILDATVELTDADVCTVLTYDADNKVFDAVLRKDRTGRPVDASLPSKDGYSAEIVQGSEPVYVTDVNLLPPGTVVPQFVSRGRARAFAAVPLRFREISVGLLYVNFNEPHDFPELEKSAILQLASHAAVSIVNARLIKQQEEDRTQLRARLAPAEHFLIQSRFAATYVHRVNNVVGTIPIRVQQIREKLHDSPGVLKELEQYLDGIDGDARRVSPTVDEWNRLTTYKEELPEQLDLVDVLSRVARRVRLESPVVIRLEEQYPAGPVFVRMVAWEFYEAIYNALRNAAEAMRADGGGVLSLTVRRPDRPEPGVIQVEAHNTGRKIPEKELPYVFEAFFSSKPDSTGYGMWNFQKLVQACGGKIDIRNDANASSNGVTLFFELPVAP